MSDFMNINTSILNMSTTCFTFAHQYDAYTLSITVLLINLDVVVVAGNLLVLLAFLVDRHLRTPTHYFIGSLAAADLALGIFVLPIAITFETNGAWTFGIPLCQLWLAVDVWLCTASIYGLIMVGLDRYMAVTRPLNYKAFMTHRKALWMIASAWSISLLICLPTFVVSSWRASKAVESTCQCTQMIHGPLYIAYSAIGSFYLPTAIIGYVYARIYLTIRRIKLQGVNGVVNLDELVNPNTADQCDHSELNEPISFTSKHRRKGAVKLALSRSAPTRMTMRIHKGGYREDQTIPLLNRNRSERLMPPPQVFLSTQRRSISTPDNPTMPALGRKRLNTLSTTTSPTSSISTLAVDTIVANDRVGRSGLSESRNPSTTSFMGFLAVPSHLTSIWYQRMDAFHRYHQKLTQELGALRTVGIVTGCFVACWIGFCIVYTMHALPQCRISPDVRKESCVPNWMISTMVWFGYANSAVNPIIYGASNENFRRAFRAILKCQGVHRKTSFM